MAWHEGDLVHKLRRMCGWTVEELAARAKMNPSVIYRLEDGRTKEPKKPTIQKLSAVFGLNDRDFRNAIPVGLVHIPIAIEHKTRAKSSGQTSLPMKKSRQAAS